jgi:hypothetical protein
MLGESSRRQHVTLLLGALETILSSMGMELTRGAALAAAERAYRHFAEA